MATEYLFSNNATTTLAQSVSPTATVLNVASGTGALFPSPGQGQAFAVTLVDAATGLTNEICYCTSRSGDQLTVIRGREGTNATTWQAGDTCANYITADVMESWLQESDLNGYLTQTAGDGRYVGQAGGSVDYPALQAGVQKSTGNPWLSYNDGSGVKFAIAQPAGDYATNTALNNAVTSLNNTKANLSGGNQFSGDQTVNGRVIVGMGAGWGGGTSSGQLRWSESFLAFGAPENTTNSFTGFFQITDILGNASDNQSGINMFGVDFSGTRYDWYFAWNGRVTTPGGVLAFESDVTNLQNQINTKQAAGNYVTGLAAGKIMQDFVVAVEGSGVHDITFPQAFSGTPTTIVISHGLTNGSNSPVSVLSGWTATGFQIQTNGSTSVNFLAVGGA